MPCPEANVTYQTFLSYVKDNQKNSAVQFFEVLNSNYSSDYEKRDWPRRCEKIKSSLEQPSQKIPRVESVEPGVISGAPASNQFSSRPGQDESVEEKAESFNPPFRPYS